MRQIPHIGITVIVLPLPMSRLDFQRKRRSRERVGVWGKHRPPTPCPLPRNVVSFFELTSFPGERERE